MWQANLRATKPASALVLVALLLSPLLGFGVRASQTDDPFDNVWVLTETLVNPDDVLTEYYGGGVTPHYYTDARYEGKHREYKITETSFTIDDREVDHGNEYWWVILQANFQEPPTTLVPGETITLDATFQTEGTLNEGIGFGMQFQYRGDGLTAQPAGVYWYTPWHPDYDGTSSTTYTFDIPQAYSGGEIAIHVGLWNEPPCHVVWKYRAVTAAEDEPTEATQTSEASDTDTGGADDTGAAQPTATDAGDTDTGGADDTGATQPTATDVGDTDTGGADTSAADTSSGEPAATDASATDTAATVTDTPDTGSGVLRGDCVKDGRLDERDATCALRMSVGLLLPDLSVDMDGNQHVTSRDAALILQQVNVSRGGP